MGSFANIPNLSVAPVQVDPVNAFSKQLQMRNLQQEIGLRQQEMELRRQQIGEAQSRGEQLKRNLEDDQIYASGIAQNTTAGPDGNPVVNWDGAKQQFAQQGRGHLVMKTLAEQIASDKDAIANQKGKLDNVQKLHETIAQLVGPLANVDPNTSPEDLEKMNTVARNDYIKSDIGPPELWPTTFNSTFNKTTFQAGQTAVQQAQNARAVLEHADKANELKAKMAVDFPKTMEGVTSALASYLRTANSPEEWNGGASVMHNVEDTWRRAGFLPSNAPDGTPLPYMSDTAFKLFGPYSEDNKKRAATIGLTPAQASEAAERQARLPGITAEGEQKARQNTSQKLFAAAQQGPAQYTRAWDGLDDDTQKLFPDPSQWDPKKTPQMVREVGMTGAQGALAEYREEPKPTKPATPGQFSQVAAKKAAALAKSKAQLDKELGAVTIQGKLIDPQAAESAWEDHINRVRDAQNAYEEEVSTLSGNAVNHNDWADQLQVPTPITQAVQGSGRQKTTPAETQPPFWRRVTGIGATPPAATPATPPPTTRPPSAPATPAPATPTASPAGATPPAVKPATSGVAQPPRRLELPSGKVRITLPNGKIREFASAKEADAFSDAAGWTWGK